MSDTPIPGHLQILDSLVRQSRLNDAVTAALVTVGEVLTASDEIERELREDIATLAVEVGRLNARVESLTQTVGRLMSLVEPLPAELHSVRVEP